MARQVLKGRGRRAKPARYAIFVTHRAGEPILMGRRDYTRAEAQSKVSSLRRGLRGMETSSARPIVIKYVKQAD